MKFKFFMSDCWGDDYIIDVIANNEKEAWRIATMVDHYAFPEKLLGVEE
jgi:hypothetical protein